MIDINILLLRAPPNLLHELDDLRVDKLQFCYPRVSTRSRGCPTRIDLNIIIRGICLLGPRTVFLLFCDVLFTIFGGFFGWNLSLLSLRRPRTEQSFGSRIFHRFLRNTPFQRFPTWGGIFNFTIIIIFKFNYFGIIRAILDIFPSFTPVPAFRGFGIRKRCKSCPQLRNVVKQFLDTSILKGDWQDFT